MHPSALRQRLRQRLTAALRDRDRAGAATLRSVLAALDNAEAVPISSAPSAGSQHVAGAAVGVGAGDAPRRILDAAEERAVLDGEIAELRASADDYAALGAVDRAEDLRRSVALIEEAAGL